MSKSFSRWLGMLFAGLCLALLSGPSFAAFAPGIGFRLEGCRLPAGSTLPNPAEGNQFICNAPAYTTGNLGKNWNELDLVPYRLTLDAGNSADGLPYTIAVVVDREDAGKPGYDVLSVPKKRSGSCTISVSPPLDADAAFVATPGLGGISKSLYRLMTITQPKNTTCVFDFYARLALGSHLFPGSSLHANLATINGGVLGTNDIGARDVSIPVKEIAPQELSKVMSASAGSDYTWSVSKSGPATVDLGNVCAKDAPFTGSANIVVTWTKTAAALGKIKIETTITAKNPAARSIVVKVTDRIYKGATQTTQIGGDKLSGPILVPANQSKVVLTHTEEVDAATYGLTIGSQLNDVATAEYIDEVTQVPVPGTTTASATATVQSGGAVTNNSAVVTDNETIGADLAFSVSPLPIGGSVPAGYVAGTKVTSLDWAVTGLTTSGSLTFNKTIHLSTRRVLDPSGLLSDKAAVAASDGYAASSDELKTAIKSDASVKVVVNKTIPVGLLGAGQTLVVTFSIKGVDTGATDQKTLTFVPGGTTSQQLTFSGLKPDSYEVTEVSALVNGVDSGLKPSDGVTVKTVNLRVGAGGLISKCEDQVAFDNVIGGGTPKVQVKKETVPTTLVTGDPTTYAFKLYGPANTVISTVVATANGAAELFPIVLDVPGSYKVVEDPLPTDPWFYFSKSSECEFTVPFPFPVNKTYSCTYTNKKKGLVKVIKTVSGAAPTGTQSFTFELWQALTAVVGTGSKVEGPLAANAGSVGTINFSANLTPDATYQMCETAMLPGWQTDIGGFVPNSLLADGTTNPSVDNSVRCVNFTAGAGTTTIIKVNNTPPPQGDARTIGYWRNWASCSASKGKQAPILDQTLAAATPPGIQYGSNYLVTGDCVKAVALLSKQDFSGKNRASDPLFNMAAQLVAAELNYAKGALTCQPITDAIASANTLLSGHGFNGSYPYSPKLSAGEAANANSPATQLDNYNNNRPGGC
jgi:hypothetical protein